MASEWGFCRLEELAAANKGSIAIGPFGSRLKADCYVDEGVCLIRGTNLSNSASLSGHFVYISEATAKTLGNANLKSEDLVFPHRGSIGAVGIVPADAKRYALSTSLMKISLDRARALPSFYYYYFRSGPGRSELLKNASQVGTPGIATPLASLRGCMVPFPPIGEQKSVVRVLSALDDRIDLLRETNTTLKDIAQALFKSWFVDFVPVRAKAEGREPEGMDAATAALFPRDFEESELGLIPKGWGVGQLGDIVEVIDCLHAKKPQLLIEGRPYLQLNCIREDGLLNVDSAAKISDSDYAKWISRIEVCQGDCVVTNVGRVGAIAQIPAAFKAAIGRNMTALRAKPESAFPTFLIELLQSAAMRAEIVHKTDAGTILNALNVKSIPGLRFVCPSARLMRQFEETTRPLRASMEVNLSRVETLARTRDTLLPRLISGKLRLPDTEAFMEAQA